MSTNLSEFYHGFEVHLKFRDRVLAGLPKRKDLLADMISANMKFVDDDKPPFDQVLEEDATAVGAVEPDEAVDLDAYCRVFERNAFGPAIVDRQIKALMREAAVGLRLVSTWGFRDSIAEYCVVGPIGTGAGPRQRRINFTDDAGVTRAEPDGTVDLAGNVMTRQGKRDIVSRSEYIERAALCFEVWVLETQMKAVGKRKAVITPVDMENMWAIAGEIGLGAGRSLGYGTFDVTHYRDMGGGKD